MTFENFKELYKASTLKEVEKATVLYHATYKDCLKSILEKGLLADSSEFWHSEKNEDNKLYFAFDADDAVEWAEVGKPEQEEWLVNMGYDTETPDITESPVVVLAVNISDLDVDNIVPDDILCEDMYEDDEMDACVTTCAYTKDIPADKLYICDITSDEYLKPMVKLSSVTNVDELDSKFMVED